MRAAKILTTSCVVAGLLLLIIWPFAFRPPAPDAGRQALAQHGVRNLVYFGFVCFVWLGAASSAVWLAKIQLREFKEQETENLKSLIEGSLRDHQKK